MPLRFVSLLLLAISLASCAHTPPLSGPHLAVLPLTELPPPGPNAAEYRLYHVGAFDTLEFSVFGVEELSRREIRADADGRISFPLAGEIRARGMTLDQLAREVENRLRGRFIRNPQVSVNVKDVVSRTVTVSGQVKEPGAYPVLGTMSLMRAIALAKGISDLANANEVVIFRTVGDQRMAALYSLSSIEAGRYADPEIFADDIVMVGDSPGRRLFRDVMSVLPYALSPIITAVQQF